MPILVSSSPVSLADRSQRREAQAKHPDWQELFQGTDAPETDSPANLRGEAGHHHRRRAHA
ncbi:MAG: hypothetical protein ACYTG0_16635 [Planctomycetota bacterium]